MLAYMSIKTKILEYMRENNLKAGDRLPTEKELSKTLNIGRLTLREGLNALKSEGVIVAVQGRGTFVSFNSQNIDDSLNENSSVTEMIRRNGRTPGVSYFKKEIQKADKKIIKALQLEPHSDVSVCIRVRTADDEPVVLTKDYLAPIVAPAFLEMKKEDISLYEFLEKKSDIKIGAGMAEIVPLKSDKMVSEMLGISVGTLLLLLMVTIQDIYGTPIIYAEEYFLADKFKFIVTRGNR